MKAAILLLLVAVVCIHAGFSPMQGARKGLSKSQRDARNTNGICPGLLCLKDGAACDYTTNQFDLCSSASYCNPSGVCAPALADGATCTDSESCHGDDSWCLFATTGATSGVCTPSTYSATLNQTCQVGSPNGPYAYCTSAYQCALLPNATTTTCISLPSTAGADCSYYGECSGPYFCSATANYTCTALFSVANGAACTDTTECVVGSYCPDGRSPVCTAGFSSSNSACDGSGQCSNPKEACGCPLTTKAGSSGTCIAPYVYTATTAGYVTQLESCRLTSNCNTEDCFADCKTLICEAYHTFDAQYPSALSCFNTPQDYVANCGVNAGSTSSGCMNHAIIGAVALAAMTAL